MKRITLISTFLLLALSVAAQEAYYDFSAPNESGQVLYYNILDPAAHTVELTCPGPIESTYQGGWEGYQQPSGRLVLPSSVHYNGIDYSVVAVGDYAFQNCNSIRDEILVPSAVVRIGKYAFQLSSYSNICRLVLTEGLVEVDEYACAGSDFQIDQLPNSLERIGVVGFAENNFPRHLVLPQSLRVIDAAAFSTCYTIHELTIPENIDSIESNAFYFNTQLQKVNFNARNCSYLASNAFEDASVSTLVIGEQVQSITPCMYINGVNTITVKAKTPPIITENTFAYFTPVFYVPKGCWNAYQNAPYWKDITNMYEFPGSFAPEGAEWYFSKLSTQSILNDYHRMEVLRKETITVNGEAVEVSVISGPLHSDELQYVYEKDDMVYWYNPTQDNFTTLYDFNAKVGDSWRVSVGSENYEVMVVAIQNLIYDHCAYQVQWVRNIGSNTNFSGKIIKGIGFDHGLFPLETSEAASDTVFIDGIRCYLENDSTLYQNGYLDCDQIVGWNGFVWYYEITNENGDRTYQYLQCVGDTAVAGERPKIIVRTNTIYDDKGKQQTVTHEYVYERDSVVYWWNKELQEFTTLYDLTADVGDEWVINVGTESLVMHVDAVSDYEYDGRTLKMLSVSDENDLFSGDIVCGIGHLTSFFPERLMNRGGGYRVEGFRCYWQDGELVFKLGEKDCDAVYQEYHNQGVDETETSGFRIYPNPANDVIVVETPEGATLQEYRITNLLGQTMLTGTSQTINVSSLPSGMYFLTLGTQTLKFTKQ